MNLTQTPVTLILIILQIVIFLLGPAKWVDCNDTGLSQTILQSVIHINLYHLLVNLYSLYNLSYIERSYGSFSYLLLIVVLLVLTSWLQTVFAKTPWWPFSTCSVGFSAVLLGLIVFDRLNLNEWNIDLSQLQYMLILLLVPVLTNPKVSLTGHLAGILAGLILSVVAGATGLDL